LLERRILFLLSCLKEQKLVEERTRWKAW